LAPLLQSEVHEYRFGICMRLAIDRR